MKVLLWTLLLVTALARADGSDEAYFREQEKDFQKIQREKRAREVRRSQDRENFLREREKYAEEKRRALHEYMEHKADRAPASDEEGEDNLRRAQEERLQEEARRASVTAAERRETARRKALKEFDSTDVKLREHAPWRLN
jgi:hypothetical protein